MKFDLSLRW